jgi:hypothetical protein
MRDDALGSLSFEAAGRGNFCPEAKRGQTSRTPRKREALRRQLMAKDRSISHE